MTMMPENKEIRAIVRGELKGNWTQPVLCTLVYLLLIAGISVIPFAGWIVTILVGAPLAYGFTLTFLGFMRNENRTEMVGQPFKVFNNYERYLGRLTLGSYLYSFMDLIADYPRHHQSLCIRYDSLYYERPTGTQCCGLY